MIENFRKLLLRFSSTVFFTTSIILFIIGGVPSPLVEKDISQSSEKDLISCPNKVNES